VTPANWDGHQPAPRSRRPGVGRQVAWASVPVWSIGFLSFVPFLAFAVINRTKADWAVFAAYLAATIAMIVAVGAVNSNSGAGAAVGGFVIALAGCAAIHSAVLFRPGRGQPVTIPPGPAGRAERNREAVAEAKSRIEARKQARHLAASNPALARDLRIGRPDLPRNYDDGGLVDVNNCPGPVLAGQLSLTPAEVSEVLTARDRLGGRFASADELCAYTSLSPDRVDSLRDLMLFT